MQTFADFAALPEGAPYELIGGALVMEPPPTTFHQSISRDLGFLMWEYVRQRKLGEVLFAPIGVYLGEHDTYQPDILFVSNERAERIGKQWIYGAPDLVAEILSPSTARYDLHEKRRQYEAAGVLEYWIVDPKRHSVDVVRLVDGRFAPFDSAVGGGVVRSFLLSGFQADLADIF